MTVAQFLHRSQEHVFLISTRLGFPMAVVSVVLTAALSALILSCRARLRTGWQW